MVELVGIPNAKIWLEALVKSADELAKTTLNVSGCDVLERSGHVPWMDTMGAYVPWVCNGYSVQLGIISTRDGCQNLAKMLLEYKENETIEDEDMEDAIQEIMNMLAGMSKGIVGGAVTAKNMGLPVFINGYIEITSAQVVLSELVQINAIYCYLLVLHQH